MGADHQETSLTRGGVKSRNHLALQRLREIRKRQVATEHDVEGSARRLTSDVLINPLDVVAEVRQKSPIPVRPFKCRRPKIIRQILERRYRINRVPCSLQDMRICVGGDNAQRYVES